MCQTACNTLSFWLQSLPTFHLINWLNREGETKRALWVPSLYSDYLAGRRGFVIKLKNFQCRFEGGRCLMCQQEIIPGAKFAVVSARHLAQQQPGSRLDSDEIFGLSQLRVIERDLQRPSVLQIIQEQAQKKLKTEFLEYPMNIVLHILEEFQRCSLCKRLSCAKRIGSPIKMSIRQDTILNVPKRLTRYEARPVSEQLELPLQSMQDGNQQTISLDEDPRNRTSVPIHVASTSQR